MRGEEGGRELPKESQNLCHIVKNKIEFSVTPLCPNVTVTLSRIITNFLPTESLRSCAASQKERHPPIGIQHCKPYSPLTGLTIFF